MDLGTCKHRDVRDFDNLWCCMSCGETVYMWQGFELKSSADTDNSIQGLSHTYSDLRLSTGQAIRLVVLLPGRFADPIYCTIATVHLYKEQFDALSYTWATEDGDYSKTGRINCPDGVIPITENCEDALRQLRLPYLPRQLWVDAICIDQTNVKERNHQVGLMDQIFRAAGRVHICIKDASQRYTELINRLESDEFHCPESRVIDQATELFRRRYFSRLVIQEVLLARDIVLHVNSEATLLASTTLDKLLPWISIHPLLEKRRQITEFPIDLDFVGMKILDCLRISIDASSSDPRDQIFGVLGLLPDRTRSFIPVDYSLSYEQVFGLAVMLCIAECCDLTIIMYASLPATPEFESACSFGLEEFRRFVLDRKDRQYGFYHPLPRFGGKRRWRSHVSVAMYSRTTQSLEPVLDRIPPDAALSSTIQQSSTQFPLEQLLPRMKVRAHLLDISCESMRGANELPKYLEFLENIPSEMLLDDENFGSSDTKYSYWGWLGRLFQYPKNWDPSEDHVQQTSGITQSIFNYHDFEKFTMEIKTVPISHMFRTHYSVGFSTSNHIAGDHVFAIDGAYVPFLLRKVSSNTYRIVGYCYLWAAGELDYWSQGTYKGLWLERPVDLGEGTRRIEIY